MRITHLFAGALALSVVTAGMQAQDRRDREERDRDRAERERDRVERQRDREELSTKLRGAMAKATGQDEDRGYLGISTGTSGRRDTLGLLVTDVTPGGPADRAGLQEGDRIVSINGTSLRISEDDAGEPD